ncbi:MAG: Hsp20 family protein [Caldithrix sp.]|nr:Hsp20 family protein [Caldithrix sp.]
MVLNRMFFEEPWHEVERIQNEMNRLFNSRLSRGRLAYPAVNVWNDSEKVIVTTELPGYDPQKIDLSILNDELVIRGKREPEKSGDDIQIHRQERPIGDFERTVALPYRVDSEKVDAHYEKGVLTITLPRAESDKPRKISIKSK